MDRRNLLKAALASIAAGLGGGRAANAQPRPEESGTADLPAVLKALPGAVLRSMRDWWDDDLSVMDFIPFAERVAIRLGTSRADVSAYLNRANAAWRARPSARLRLPAGDYHIADTVLFDHPLRGTLVWEGAIVADVSGRPAVIIGQAAAATNGIHVVGGIKVRRPAIDMDDGGRTSGSTGLVLRNLFCSTVRIDEVHNFSVGVRCEGVGGVGRNFCYNQVHLGYLKDNQRGLVLTAAGASSCNENSFYGGAFGHSRSYPSFRGTVNLEIEHNPATGYELNNNIFLHPSLEAIDGATVAAVINGQHNVLWRPRIETLAEQSRFPVRFTANSAHCHFEGGFFAYQSNIDDRGRNNSWHTSEGMALRRPVRDRPELGVVSLRSTADSAAAVLRGEDSSGAETFRLRGTGIGESRQHFYFEKGIRFASGDGTRIDRGIFAGAGSPEGAQVARPGSLFLRTDGGDGTVLHVKERGDGATGWRRLGQAAAVRHAAGPAPTKAEFDALIDALKAARLMA